MRETLVIRKSLHGLSVSRRFIGIVKLGLKGTSFHFFAYLLSPSTFNFFIFVVQKYLISLDYSEVFPSHSPATLASLLLFTWWRKIAFL